MSSKDSSAIKGTREYKKKIKRAEKWGGGSRKKEDEPSFQKMNEIFNESLEVLKLLEEFKSTIHEPEDEVSQRILAIDIGSVLIRLKEDNSKDSLKEIFALLMCEIYEFYALTLEDYNMTPKEKEFKRRWKSILDGFNP